LTVTSTSLAFFQQFSSSVTAGTYTSTSSTFTTLINAIQTFADGFLAINARYTPSNGGLAEQFDKNTGAPLSAVDLTWSYASALTAFAARQGISPASWGAAGLVVPSGTCQGNTGPTVQATFNVVATTQLGGTPLHSLLTSHREFHTYKNLVENIFLAGSLGALENWSPDNAIALNANSYPTWSGKSNQRRANPGVLMTCFYSHGYYSCQHELSVQIHSQVQWCCYLGR
jgi:glucoamylase